MKPIHRSKYISVFVPAGTGQGATLEFPLDQTLQGAHITGIELVTDAEQTITPDGQLVAPLSECLKATLTLVDMSSQMRQQGYALPLLSPALNGGIWKEFEPFPVNWQGSYVEFEDAPAGLPYAFLFQVHYLPKK